MATSTNAHGPAGLAIAEAGLVLAPEATRLPLDREAELSGNGAAAAGGVEPAYDIALGGVAG